MFTAAPEHISFSARILACSYMLASSFLRRLRKQRLSRRALEWELQQCALCWGRDLMQWCEAPPDHYCKEGTKSQGFGRFTHVVVPSYVRPHIPLTGTETTAAQECDFISKENNKFYLHALRTDTMYLGVIRLVGESLIPIHTAAAIAVDKICHQKLPHAVQAAVANATDSDRCLARCDSAPGARKNKAPTGGSSRSYNTIRSTMLLTWLLLCRMLPVARRPPYLSLVWMLPISFVNTKAASSPSSSSHSLTN